MERIEKAIRMSEEQFKRIIGTTTPVFQTMIEVLQAAFVKLHRLGGKPASLLVGDKLLIALDFNCAKSSVGRSIAWVEETLSAGGRFQRPGKEALLNDDFIQTIAVDVTEHPVQRPKKIRKTGTPARKNDARSSRK